MAHAQKPSHKGSSMKDWHGSRGGYRKERRNGRYGDAKPASEFASRSATNGKRNPGGSHGIMRD